MPTPAPPPACQRTVRNAVERRSLLRVLITGANGLVGRSLTRPRRIPLRCIMELSLVHGRDTYPFLKVGHRISTRWTAWWRPTREFTNIQTVVVGSTVTPAPAVAE